MKIQKPVHCILVYSLILFSVLSLHAQDLEVEFQENVMIPMSDGVELAAHVFLPKADGPFPTLLARTPYGKGDEKNGDGQYYASRGYAVVIQDTRGKGNSEGTWEPFLYDGKDGYDTHEWIGRQPWCNGSIGTFGGSYVGFTQWVSAPYASKYLKAMVPVVPMCDAYREGVYEGGAINLALMLGWGTLVSPLTKDTASIKWDEYYRFLPLLEWEKFLGYEIFYLKDWVKHPTYDDYWKKRGIDDRYSDINVPILNFGGWYDIFSKATLEQVDRVRHESNNIPIRRNQFVVIGAWHHGGSDKGKVGELDFGKDCDLDRRTMQTKWFDYWLKDKKTGVEDWPPLYLFVMGENVWRSENEWPLKRTEFTNYYIHSEGEANTLEGDGVLATTPPLEDNKDTFVYDPENPVPTKGGNNLFGVEAGPYDQREIEKREDVLVYTTQPLKKAVEVTGPVKMVLFASTTAKDTDFTAKLVDVYPDGRAINLCDGIIRTRYRESDTDLTLIEPNKIYRYEIDLWVTSNVFLPEHRIREEVSSSNFPRFDRNPNSGKKFGTDRELFKATQTIYHDAGHASHLVLPVIPRN